MRRFFVAGNWKMNKTGEEARALVAEMLPGLQAVSSIDRAVCPPSPYLMQVSAMLVGSDVLLGAQNMYWEDSGAFTGEISPTMVAEFCQCVILGHSERRAYFGETDETVNRKVKAAFTHNLVPILCVGETLEENEAGRTAEVVERQLRGGMQDLDQAQAARVVIAYEPVWAIGTGRAATPALANNVHAGVIRPVIADMFGDGVAQIIRIQYGGSVTAKNAAELFAMPDIDGALVGGASLKPADFVAIVQAAAAAMEARQA